MDAAVPGDVNEADQSIIFPGAEINSLLEYAHAAAVAIRARVAAVVDVALAAVDVAATVFVMNECGRFHRRHLLAEARRHLALVLRGRRRDPGLDDQIVAATISTYCLDISEPKTVRGLEAGYRLYTARWALSDLTARRRPPTPAPDPDRRPPADPGEPAAPRSSGQDAGEWEIPRIPLQYVTAAALLTARGAPCPKPLKAASPTWTWQAWSSWPLRCSWCCSSPANGICGAGTSPWRRASGSRPRASYTRTALRVTPAALAACPIVSPGGGILAPPHSHS